MDFGSTLDELKTAVHQQHQGQAARLEQFDAHLDTVRMIIDHLADEAVRHGEGSN